jgi:low temperature requirement protein LtrA
MPRAPVTRCRQHGSPVNGQIVSTAGLIVLAVGYELTIEEPTAPSTVVLSLLLFGGPLLYLGLQTWYLRALTGRYSRSRLIGAAVLVVAGAVVWTLPSVIALAISSVMLGLLAVRISLQTHRTLSRREVLLDRP